MPLETLRQDAQPNVKNFTIESPDQEGQVFNQEKILGSDFGEYLYNELKSYVEEEKPGDLIDHFQNLAILYPEKIKRFSKDRNLWARLENELIGSIANGIDEENIQLAYLMKLLFTEKFLDDYASEREYNKALSETLQSKASLIELIKYIDREALNKIDDIDWDQVFLDETRNDLDARDRVINLAAFRFVFPEKVVEVLKSSDILKKAIRDLEEDIEILDDIRKMKKDEDNNEGRGIRQQIFMITEMAARIKILSAEKAEITDKGYVIEMPLIKEKLDLPPQVKQY